LKDHYKTLGIKRSATPEEVKKAYFEMAKKHHPDSGDETEVRKFHEVAEAYKILSDTEAKKSYDISLGAVEAEAKRVEAKPTHQSIHKQKRAEYRDDELKEYHRNRYRKAVLRVILFTTMLGLIGSIIGIILGGIMLWSFVAGLFIGFSYSINQNFNVKTFFKSDRTHKAFRIFTWLVFIIGFGYFVWLIGRDLF
jgi:curved DNA-binding protein CbpA